MSSSKSINDINRYKLRAKHKNMMMNLLFIVLCLLLNACGVGGPSGPTDPESPAPEIHAPIDRIADDEVRQ